MDREVIEQKLESLRHCLQRVESKCQADAQTLAADPDLQDIVALNLSRAVQACVDIGAGISVPPPDTMGQTFDLLAQAGVLPTAPASRMQKAVGYRNIAVPRYESINWYIEHSIAKKHLTDFSEFAEAVSRRCIQQP